jgi:hypothetical protein
MFLEVLRWASLAVCERPARVGRWLSSGWAFFPVVVFFFSRAAVFAATGLSLLWEPTLQRQNVPRDWVGQYPPLDGLFRWDSGHYIIITQQGYDTLERTNFWPGYPLVCRFVVWLTGMHVVASMMLVANVFSFIGLLLVYRVAMKVEGAQVARTVILLMVAYPFAFFQAAAYPESMVICLTAGAVLLALNGRHILAGFVLATAVITRHVALTAGAALLGAQIRQRKPGWLGMLRPALIGLVLPFVAVAIYAAYLKQRFDDPIAFVTARKLYWGDGFSNIFTLSGTYWYSYVPLTWLMTICTLFLWTKKRWLELAGAATAWLVLVAVVSATGLGRHTASIWPAFVPPAYLLTKNQQWATGVVACLAIFQGLFIFLYAHQYHVL